MNLLDRPTDAQTRLAPAQAQQKHLLRETAVSVVINAFLSAFFVWLIFGGRAQVPLWGSSGLARDFIPQTFVIALMATLVPSAITRKRLRNGQLGPGRTRATKLPRNLFVRALLFAIAVTAAAVPAVVAILGVGAIKSLPFASVLILKVGYGALLALIVTSLALRIELAGL